MRRSVVNTMSGLSLAVVGLSLRASNLTTSALSPAPTGIVQTSPRPAPHAKPKTPKATASAAPQALFTRAPQQRPVGVPTRAAIAVPPPAAAPRPSPTRSRAPSSVTINGAPADTQYGPVQVQITITNRRIVRADAIDYPQNTWQDQQINSQAIPQLDQETLDAQSANIDTVSGATYTSDGYRRSLQSALDAAHSAGAL